MKTNVVCLALLIGVSASTGCVMTKGAKHIQYQNGYVAEEWKGVMPYPATIGDGTVVVAPRWWDGYSYGTPVVVYPRPVRRCSTYQASVDRFRYDYQYRRDRGRCRRW